jgi:hypothetical protein
MFFMEYMTKSNVKEIGTMNLQKYQSFVKTVESGSFTKAAVALNYTQSGISRMIKDLETEWGVALLERNRAGVSLTSDGLKLLPQICYRRLRMDPPIAGKRTHLNGDSG